MSIRLEFYCTSLFFHIYFLLIEAPHFRRSIPCVTDIKKQSQMAALSKERDNLRSAIKAYRSLFDTTQQLVKELRSTFFGCHLLIEKKLLVLSMTY